MSQSTVEDRVKEIVGRQLGISPSEIQLNFSFVEDLGADSLDTVELVMALEEEFGCEILDEHASAISTVQDAVDYLKKHANSNSSENGVDG